MWHGMLTGQVEAEDFSDKAADKAKEVNENVDKAAEKSCWQSPTMWNN